MAARSNRWTRASRHTSDCPQKVDAEQGNGGRNGDGLLVSPLSNLGSAVSSELGHDDDDGGFWEVDAMDDTSITRECCRDRKDVLEWQGSDQIASQQMQELIEEAIQGELNIPSSSGYGGHPCPSPVEHHMQDEWKEDELCPIIGDALQQEFEMLRAVWPDEAELRIEEHCGTHRNSWLALVIFKLMPMTGGGNEQCFVCGDLVLSVPRSYPLTQLEVTFASTRGLSDTQVSQLLETMNQASKRLIGEDALYSMLQLAQEELTSMNQPTGLCSICYRDISEPAHCSTEHPVQHRPFNGEERTAVARTPCFHVFHNICLAHHWQTESDADSGQNVCPTLEATISVSCPVCTSALTWNCIPQIHSLVPKQRATARSKAVESSGVCTADSGYGDEETDTVDCSILSNLSVDVPDTVTYFEVVHHCGTCFRTKPRWNSKLDSGQVHKGFTGIVAETVEGDTTYIRPKDSKYWLPVKGLSASVKLLHVETATAASEKAACVTGTEGPNVRVSAGVPCSRKKNHQPHSSSHAGAHWHVQLQNSTTAHAGTNGTCSVKLVGTAGESEEHSINDGGGVKTGDLLEFNVYVEGDIGNLAFVEMKNTSATTWRPHWIRATSPIGVDFFVYSRQWVAKGRTQKAYVDVSGSVGLRGLPAPTSQKKR